MYYLSPSIPHSQDMSPTKQKGLVLLELNFCCRKYKKQSGQRMDMMPDREGGIQAHMGEQGREGDTGGGIVP